MDAVENQLPACFIGDFAKRAIRGITSGFRFDTAKATAIAGIGKTGVQVVTIPPQLFPRSRTDLARQQTRMLDIAGTATSFESAAQQIMADPPET